MNQHSVLQPDSSNLKFIDLFCGMGGFHLGINQACEKYQKQATCVFASDIDKFAIKTYKSNFNITPHGDITKILSTEIPKHDILCAGFPCQSFSSIGKREGFDNKTKGALFFEICRILKHHKPSVCLLENVPGILTHNKGETFKIICQNLEKIGYVIHYKVHNAVDFGLPAIRKRVFIIGFLNKKYWEIFKWPQSTCEPNNYVGIGTIIEHHEDGYCITKHLQDTYLFRKKNGEKKNDNRPRVVDKNTLLPANTLVSSYHKIQRLTGTFVRDGKTGLRLFSENECKQIMGFPKEFKMPVSRTQMYRQTGNSVSVPIIKAIIEELFKIL